MISETKRRRSLFYVGQDAALCKELESLFAADFTLIREEKPETALAIMKRMETPVLAVLLACSYPQTQLLRFLKEMHVQLMLSDIPVLLLPSESTDVTELLREDGAVDILERPLCREIVVNRIRNAARLKESITFAEVERMLKVLPSNIYLKDREGRYIFCTHYWHHLEHNNDPDWTIRGKTDVDIRKDKENALEAMKKDMELIESGIGAQYVIEINADGLQEFFEVIKQPLREEDGSVKGIVGLINNVTEHEQMKNSLKERARRDELTGFYNRSYFDEYLQTLLPKAAFPVSIISADCDDLKTVNDTHGHLVGDEYIRMAALLMKSVLPEQSRMFRTGGDEFVLILPDTSEEQVHAYIAEMQEKEKKFGVKGKNLSVSFGAAVMHSAADSAELCIAVSDHSMYQDKRRKKKAR